ncbi:MAG: phosphoribosylamine--glycine ligase [Candidatus Micrarchaeota archaeon]
MRVLLIGNGAREHAIAEKISADAELITIMAKKNPAIAKLSKKHFICDINNPLEVSACAKDLDIDVAFASPDSTLANGITDALDKIGISTSSPTKSAARIEWDKEYMRSLMKDNKLSGRVEHEIVHNLKDAKEVMTRLGNVALKPIGLTGGKGVKVSGDHFTNIQGALSYANEVLLKDKKLLIEEKIEGEEFSLQVFSDGTHIYDMPPVQDHKRAFENDLGDNTGGMGSYSTGKLLPFIEQNDIEQGRKILQEIVHAMRKEKNSFKGVMYGQFMACKGGVKVIEINARFGDPEAINVLALLKNSLTDMFLSIADGNLERPEFSDQSTVVKYLVPEGYPTKPIADSPLLIDEQKVLASNAKLYYASVYEKDSVIYTSSSRAIATLGIANTLEEAEQKAQIACNAVKGKVWHRKDIGTKELVNKRIVHMKIIRQGAGSDGQ